MKKIEKTKKVFISYVNENIDDVQRLVQALTVKGINLWWDKNELQGGDIWKEVIEEAVDEGSYFIACFSKEFLEKERTFANAELELAYKQITERNGNKWFIPIALNEFEIPRKSIGTKRLRDFQFVRMYPDWQTGVNKILKALGRNSNILEREIKELNPEYCGLLELSSWNKEHQLTKDNLKSTITSNRPSVDFFIRDVDKYQKHIDYFISQKKRGTNLYCTEFSLDWNEGHPDVDNLTMNLSTADFSEKLAVQEMLKDSDFKNKILNYIKHTDDGQYKYFKNALPTAVIACITILNKDKDKFFALQRSGKVATDKYVWTNAVYETMSFQKEDKNIYDTIERGLKEEMNLEPKDYSEPFISFMGIVIEKLTLVVKCTVSVNISDDEVLTNFPENESISEVERGMYGWFPFKKELIYDFIKADSTEKSYLYKLYESVCREKGKDFKGIFFQGRFTLAESFRVQNLIT